MFSSRSYFLKLCTSLPLWLASDIFRHRQLQNGTYLSRITIRLKFVSHMKLYFRFSPFHWWQWLLTLSPETKYILLRFLSLLFPLLEWEDCYRFHELFVWLIYCSKYLLPSQQKLPLSCYILIPLNSRITP